MLTEDVGVNDESRIRYRALRRGYRLMATRGAESKRREKAGIGGYLLINIATDAVALATATLSDIAEFLKHHDQARERQLH